MCVETEYRCRECGGRTWHDHTPTHVTHVTHEGLTPIVFQVVG